MLGEDSFDFLLAMLFLGGVGKIIVGSNPTLSANRQAIFHAACWGGFLSGALLALVQIGSSQSASDSWTGTVISSMLVALLFIPGWYLAVVILVWLWEYPLGWPFRLMRRWRNYRRSVRFEWENERGTMAQQHAERNAKRTQQESSRRQAADQQRRDNARLQCQLLYDRHAGELQERFPPERLAAYFEQYLSDTHPPEAVEERAKLLRELIQDHLKDVEPTKKSFASLAEIAAHFTHQRQEVAALGYDQDTIDSMLTAVNEEEDAAIRTFMAH